MAHIRKLPSGKWQAIVRHPAGHKITRTDGLKRTVQQWATETETALRLGVTPATPGRGLTVAEWETRWTAARRVEPATAAKNASHMTVHLLPKWKTWPLSSIGRLDVQAWVGDMTRTGVGAPTVAAVYRLLAGMLGDAVLEGHLQVSPCRQIDLPKVVRPVPRWLTREEYDRIQLHLADGPATDRAMVGLGCFTGLRPGELAGLDVGDIDHDRRMVYVHQVMTRTGMRSYGKSHSSTRWVPFPDEVAALLWPLCADRGHGPVFTSPDGERVSDTNWRSRVWVPALKAAGVAYARPYVMRHTAASWLVQDGVPTWDIVQLLGHASSRLVDVYAHLAPKVHDRIRGAWAVHAQQQEAPHPEPDGGPDLHLRPVGDTGIEPVTSSVSGKSGRVSEQDLWR